MTDRGVVVTDGNERATLAVVRSLGARGVPVYVGAETPRSLAGSSRYCTASFVYPSPWADPRGYIDSLVETATSRNAAVLLPMTDMAMELVSERAAEFPNTTALPIPSLEQYHRLSDKFGLTAWAEQNGIPVPPTIYVADGQIQQALAAIEAWPVVIKPGRSLLKKDGHWRKTSVLIARDAAELRKLYHDHWYLKLPSMIQGFVAGHGEGVFGLFEQGKPLALFAHRRLRERPPSGGVSTFRESIALPEPMTSYALQIMADAKWNGVAMVEFKIDRVTGTPYLMEVNGRFWGSLQLAIDAGVDFPWLLHQSIGAGGIPAAPAQYRPGVRSQWWLGDLDHLVGRLKGQANDAAPSASRQSLLGTGLSLANVFAARTKNEVLRASDPGPGLLELKAYGLAKLTALGRRVGGKVQRAREKMGANISDLGLRLGLHRRALDSKFPAQPDAMLVLCRGNICRSPFAAEWLIREIRARGLDITVRSGGLDAIGGRDAYPMAKEVSPEFSLDLTDHRAAMVTQDMVDEAAIILVMEPQHVTQLTAQFPGAETKSYLLGQFSATRPMTTIDDPYGGTADEFRQCFTILEAACEGLVARIEAGKLRR